MQRTSRLVSRILSLTAIVALLSCGGGGGDSSESIANGSERARALEFVPSIVIPSDAHVRGMWSPVYPWPLISVHAAILPDGRVLTYGSDATGQQTGLRNYDVWDSSGAPDAGHMTLPNTAGTDLFCSSQLVLPTTGRLFIAGGDVWNGRNTTNAANNNSNLFDPASNTLTRGINMQRPRWYSSSTTLVNGETYIQGGRGGEDRPEVRGVDGVFRLLGGADTSGLNAFYPRNFVAPDGRLFSYDSDSGQMYYVNTTGAGSITMGARFDTARSGGWHSTTAMYRPGRILQLGGNSNGAYIIDITGATPVVTPTQSMAVRRQWANATVLADGKVAATSGTVLHDSTSQPTNHVEIWDPQTAQWTRGPEAQRMRIYHSTAILLPDGSVLTSGGGAREPTLTTDPNQNNLNAEIYYPPYLFAAGGVRAQRPTITSAPDFIDIGRTYGVDVADAGSISRVTLVRTGSASHSVNFDQRFLELTFRANGNRVTVQAPTRAGEAPPGFYMLFVFNEAGVPSVAKIVRVGVAGDPNPAVTPVLANPGAQVTVAGSAASLALNASDPNGDTLTYSASGLPPGLSIDTASGRISGTATTSGSYNVVVAATDGVNSASAGFVWTVQGSSPIVLDSPPTPAFVVANGTATFTATAAGGVNLRYQWSFGDGSAPTAWSTSPNATHVYTAGGIYAVTVSVTDDSGALLSRSVNQVVYLPTTARRPGQSTNVLVESSTFGSAPAVGNALPYGGSARLWVVNQDNDSVSAFNAATFTKLGEVAVGAAPRAIARAPNGLLWVSNKEAATLSVINPATRTVTRTIALPRGSQPFGIVMSPTSNTAYVALEAGDSVLRFDTASYAQTGSINVGPNARHLSISGDGANLYVSRFITPPLPGEASAAVTPTAAAGGQVVQISTSSLAVVRTIVLQHSNRADAEDAGRGVPNYLGAAAISPDGTQAYVPSKQDNIRRGALRDGTGLNFQNTVRAISSRIDLASGSESLAARVDHDNASVASAAAYDSRGVYLFVALETSREVAVVDAFSGAQLLRVDVGHAPQGLALSPDGRRLFVNNFMSRSVSVLDLRPLLDQGAYSVPVLATLSSVGTERLAANVLLGKRLFYDARDTRLARDRYMSCASCHNDGGHDGRTWDLTGQGEGLRNTISLRGRGGTGHGMLHWSANFDEVHDFEGQIRALAGGAGLMSDAQFSTGTVSQPLGTRKTGLSADLDALSAYLSSLNTFAPSPHRNADATLSAAALAGRAVFQSKNCAQCHAGAAFSASADAASVRNVGTIKLSSGTRLGAPLSGIDIPTLRDVWATAPYLHDGSAATLEAAVLAHNNVALTTAELNSVASYLREIGSDETSAPAPGLAGQYFNNLTLSGTPVLTRTEAVNFTWGSAAPGPGVTAGNYSVRWTGFVQAPTSGNYQFFTYSGDGVRLWVNGVQLINNWTDHNLAADASAPITLVGGQRYAVTMEYYERGGSGAAWLGWRLPGASWSFVPVPSSALFLP